MISFFYEGVQQNLNKIPNKLSLLNQNILLMFMTKMRISLCLLLFLYHKYKF